MPRVLVVVLDWNGIEDTKKCIHALLQQTWNEFKILIVDNGSIKPVVDYLNIANDKIEIVRNSSNTGFTGGVNIGIQKALSQKYPYIALLNNDAIPERNWLESLVLSAEKNNTAITTGAVLNDTGDLIDSAGEAFSDWGISFPRQRGASPDNLPPSGYTFGSTGGAVLYKTKLFQEIGLFDEKFFAYYEDADINFRTQLAGYRAYYTKEAIIYHKQGATSSKIPGFTVYQMFKNLPLLFWKNIPNKLLLKTGVRFTILYVAMLSKAVIRGTGWPAIRGVFVSIWYFWTSILWKRFNIQRSKKVSDDYIWSIFYHDLPPEQTGMRKFRKLFTGKD